MNELDNYLTINNLEWSSVERVAPPKNIPIKFKQAAIKWTLTDISPLNTPDFFSIKIDESIPGKLVNMSGDKETNPWTGVKT